MLVVHLSETRKIRDWKIDLSEIEYPYCILNKGALEEGNRFKMVYSAYKILKKHSPDIVYTGGYNHIVYWFVVLWAKINGKKVICGSDSIETDHYRVSWKEKVKRLFFTCADAVVTYGSLGKQYLIKNRINEDIIFLKPNVGDSGLYNSSPIKKPNDIYKDHNFIYVGRFSEEKNLIETMRVFYSALLKSSANNWGFIMIGSGPLAEEIGDFAKDKSDAFSIIPFKDKAELSAYYKNSSVFVLPSLSEPWGVVVNEAMMCGLPVIVSDHCGCSLDLVDGNGYVFAVDEMQELERIFVSYMTGAEDLESQSKKSIDIISKVTPDSAALQIEAIIRSLAS